MAPVAHAAAIPPDERERLEALRALAVLDTPSEERFDRITRIAARLLDAPIALVSLVDEDRQYLKACVGIARADIPRDVGFCSYAILDDVPMVVPDMAADDRFRDNPMVVGQPGLRFYVGVPLRGPSGHKVGTLCVLDTEPRALAPDQLEALQDLALWTESELANAELQGALAARKESEDLVRAILAAAVEGIVGLDRDGLVLFANPSATRLLGWSEAELIGRRGHDVFHHSYPDGTPFPWTECPIRCTATEGEVAHLEDVFWRRDGTPFPCESLSAPLRRDGELVGAVLSFVNVSERREMDRLKDEFASVVGHELRTPLTSIRASLGLLAGGVLGELPAEAADVLELAVDNTDRLVRLINQILDLERLESGAAALEIGPHPAADLVAAAVAVVEPIAAQGEVGIEVEVGEDVVRADRDRVVQTLVNLLGNAVKFSPRGATVAVRAIRQDAQLAFHVSDRGRGVPSERQDAIFDRFVQVDASDARDRGGTGLGLAIARRIVEGHGGGIWVTSTAGEGATFSFTLPAVGT